MNEIREDIKSILQKAKITDLSKILTTSPITFKIIGLNDHDIIAIKQIAAQKYYTIPYLTVTDAIEKFPDKWKHIGFNCIAIDQLLNGGIPTRGITEIFGIAGSGKSQLALQLCITVQFPENLGGLQKDAVIICTEGKFPSERLHQMIEHVHKTYDNKFENYKFADRIFIQHITDPEVLLNCLKTRLPNLMSKHNIGIIIIDSIGAIFRTESCYITRIKQLRTLADLLRNLSKQYYCGILCINQVSSVIGPTGNNSVIPCLGLGWSNLIHSRIYIQRLEPFQSSPIVDDNIISSSDKIDSTSVVVRKMQVIFSADIPSNSTTFLINENGIVDVT